LRSRTARGALLLAGAVGRGHESLSCAVGVAPRASVPRSPDMIPAP
jgi:hypothetical protein